MKTNTLNGITIIKEYIDGMLNSTSTMKALLLDAHTTQIVAGVYSQSQLLQNKVYLTSTISESHTKSHLDAIIFTRPTPQNIQYVCQQLEQPKFQRYYIFVSGILPSGLLRKLAEADVQEKVQSVQEYYADFLPINEDLWTLHSCLHSLALSTAAGTSWAPKYAAQYERNLTGLQAMLLATKRQPFAIRYAAASPCAEELARDVHDAIQADDIFQFRKTKTLLLVLDRRDDPVTPLLSQWTYQAMVHELLGLNNHRVVLKGAPNISKDLEEVVLSAAQDEFFRKNRHKNFGELGEEIQRLLKEYQTQQHAPNLSTIEEMQAFMDKFPELRSQSHNVSKHVAIMGELARLVQVCNLMDVSQFEQELACNDDHNTHWRELLEKLQSSEVKIPDKLRLGLLYALRYENSGNLHMVQSAMSKGGVPQESVQLLNILLRYAGSQSRGPGLYGDHNVVTKMTKFMTSVQGVQNVYSQHVPLLMDTLQAVYKNKLSQKSHPFVVGQTDAIPDEVLVYIIGGITYEEGTKIAEFNSQNKTKGLQVLLGGSTIHNSTSFLEEVRNTSL